MKVLLLQVLACLLTTNRFVGAKEEVERFTQTLTVENDVCVNAKPMAIGSTVTTNTTFATRDVSDIPSDCIQPNVFSDAPGVWYTFVGTGERLVVSSCSAKSGASISVFTGGCGATTLQCVVGTQNVCGRERLFLDTVQGTTYHILVKTFYEANMVFSLFVPPPVENDVCVNAKPMAIGSTVTINTTFATRDVSDIPSDCIQPNFYSDTPGVWYTFVGTGERLVVSSCSAINGASISVFTGGCGATTLQCVVGTQNVCGRERLFLDTVQGTTYHILVKTFYEANMVFSLFVPPPVENDVCVNAKPMAIGSTVFGNATYATSDEEDVVDNCNGLAPPTDPGLWYSFDGTGFVVAIDTCKSTTAVVASVYVGVCGPLTLQCVGVGNRLCLTNILYVTTEIDTTYFVLLQARTDGLTYISLRDANVSLPFPSPVSTPTSIPVMAPIDKPIAVPSIQSFPECTLLDLSSDNVFQMRASDPGSGIQIIRTDPPTTGVVVSSTYTPGDKTVAFNISIANGFMVNEIRDVSVIVQNVAGVTCIFPKLGSILDEDCENNVDCLPDAIFSFPFPTKFPNVSSIDFESIEYFSKPSFATIEFNETNLLYVPTWTGIVYDNFALQARTVAGDILILLVEYFGVNQTLVADIDIVAQNFDIIDIDGEFYDEGRRLQNVLGEFHYHHLFPQAIFIRDYKKARNFFVAIEGTDDTFFNKKEFGRILTPAQHRYIHNTLKYNELVKNELTNFQKIHNRLPLKKELTDVILRNVLDVPGVREVLRTGIKPKVDYMRNYAVKSGGREAIKQGLVQKAEKVAKARLEKASKAATPAAAKSARGVVSKLRTVKVLGIAFIASDLLFNGEELWAATLDSFEKKPLWATASILFNLLALVNPYVGFAAAAIAIADALGFWDFLWDELKPLLEGLRSVAVAWVRGDPHIKTMDGFDFDCQARGEFTLLKSLDSDFQIQGRFTEVLSTKVDTVASVTTGIVIREAAMSPLIQVSLQTGVADSIAGCLELVNIYEDGMKSTVGMVSTSPNVTMSSLNDEIIVFYQNTGVELHLYMKFSQSFGCFFTYWIYLPETYRSNEALMGLLGNANGDPFDDWQTEQGAPLSLPSMNEVLFQAGYDYCRKEWCIRDATSSLFTYDNGESFSSYFDCDAEFESGIESAFDNASQELKILCREDAQCIIDGVVGTTVDAQSVLNDRTRIEEELMERNITFTVNITYTPTITPISKPPNRKPCGLFERSLFCPFTFQGLFGRLFRRIFGLLIGA